MSFSTSIEHTNWLTVEEFRATWTMHWKLKKKVGAMIESKAWLNEKKIMLKEKDACENRDSQAFFLFLNIYSWMTDRHPSIQLFISSSSLSQSRAQTKIFFWLLLMRERHIHIDGFLVVAPCFCWIPEKKTAAAAV